MPSTLDSDERLRALIDRAEPRLRREFLAGILQLRAERSLDELADLIASGQLDEALAALDAAASRFASAVSATFLAAGEDTARFLGDALDQLISFDTVNERAVRLLRNKRSAMIREISEDTRRAIFGALGDASARGLNPRAQAREFRDTLGLTARQQQAVSNFRDALQRGSRVALSRQLRDRRFDRTIETAIREGRQLSAEQIDRMVDRYRDRMVAHRARVIARTEALRAVHEGSEEMYQQAFDEGDLIPENVQQVWLTARDARVRDTHSTMNGQVRPVGVPFTSGAGNQLRFPGDIDAPGSETIQCRCAVARRIVTV